MLGSFSSLKSVLKFKRVKIDATIFRLSYKFSVTLMIASSILVTSRQFFGDPIDCVHTHDIPKSVLNTYCWIHSTYTIPSAFWKRIAIDVPHPGIDKTVDPDERRYVKYYQWVVFCLSFQVRIRMYIPSRQRAVWPEKIAKCPQKKWKILTPLQKLPKMWVILGKIICCQRLWIVAQSAINRPIWSHWQRFLFTPVSVLS